MSGCSGTGASASGGAAPGSGAPGGGGKGGRGRGGGGDVPVTVAHASTKNVPVEVQVIGNVEAYSTISVKAQVAGQLTNAYFHEGDFVKKDDLLFTIDPRPLRGCLEPGRGESGQGPSVAGTVSSEPGTGFRPDAYTESQATRFAELFKNGIISKDQAEQVRANADAIAQAVQADKAAIESAKAAIGASSATVENARVQFGFTTIRSPITGRTGNLTVKAGQRGHCQQHGADDHQRGRADLRDVLGARGAADRRSRNTWRRANCRSAPSRRTTRRPWRPAS